VFGDGVVPVCEFGQERRAGFTPGAYECENASPVIGQEILKTHDPSGRGGRRTAAPARRCRGAVTALDRTRHPLGRVPVLEDDEASCVSRRPSACTSPTCTRRPSCCPRRARTSKRSLTSGRASRPPSSSRHSSRRRLPRKRSRPRRQGAGRFVAAAGAIANALADSEYLLDGRFGVADILAATALSILERAGFPEEVSKGSQSGSKSVRHTSAPESAKLGRRQRAEELPRPWGRWSVGSRLPTLRLEAT
jgi:hypothetical protein